MSEKGKMLNGELYDSTDSILVKERLIASKLCHQFNNLPPEKEIEKKQILNKLFQYSTDAEINSPFHCDYGYNIIIGNNFYANYSCIILDVNKVSIGDNVKFGPNVQLYTAFHPLEPNLRTTTKELGLPIFIEDNVWIGGGVIILPGVKIGKNTIIGAGSVVTKNIPQNVIAVGNPCKILRKINLPKK